jgi:hypothetical protein
MVVSRPGPLDLFAELAFQEYRADPECQARRVLLEGMIDAAAYGDLFVHGWGRPSWPVTVMVRIMYLQKEEGWSDRKMARQLKDSLRVRFLVGLPATGTTPKRTTLIDFRKRLLAQQQETLAFRQQQGFIAGTGLVTPKDGMIIDSTPYLTAAAQPTVVGLLQHAMRRVFLALRAWDPLVAGGLAKRLRLEPLLRKRFNRCAAGIASRQGRREWGRFYRKAEKLLQLLPECADARVVATCSLLARVMRERGPEGTNQVPDRITNAMDPDARCGAKGKGSRLKTWQGYKHTLLVHAATDLILAQDVMSAQHVDGDALGPTVQGLQPAFAYPGELDGDEAYTSQAHRRSMRRLRVDLVGPRRTKVRRGRVPGGGRVAKLADRRRRSRIEHDIAHVVRWRHNRQSPYLGARKAWLQATFAVCAANLVRLLTLWREKRLVLPGLPARA